jgi:hypothetical protein
LGFSPQISNFPSQQVFPPSRIYCQKSNLCIFNLIDQFSNHFLGTSASCYFSNLLWLYIFIYILWGPKNGLQQRLNNFGTLSCPQLCLGTLNHRELYFSHLPPVLFGHFLSLRIFFMAPSVVWALLLLRTFSCPPGLFGHF